MKIIGYILACIAGAAILGAVGLGIKALFFPLHVAGNSVNMAYDASDKVLNADNAIYNYEWFKRQSEAITAIRGKEEVAANAVQSFEAAAGNRKDWTFEDKTEDSRLRSIVQGLESQEKDIVAEYNARAKMATRNIFQDGKIPTALEVGTSFLK